MPTYSQILQTIGTICAVIGTASTIYVTYIAHRVHRTVTDVHRTVTTRADQHGQAIEQLQQDVATLKTTREEHP